MAKTTKHIPDDADKQARLRRQQIREQQNADTKDERDDE